MSNPMIHRYTNVPFPPYEFREYPKAVTHNGKVYVCSDEAEEKKLKATVRDYHKEAMERAKELKLDIPEDWKLEKIQAYIKKAESDLEFDRLMKEDSKPISDNKDASKSSVANQLRLAKEIK